MTYPKNFTEKIVELEAHGFTADETVSYFKEHGYNHVGLATVYRHRKGLLAAEITEETARQQRRSILKQDEANPQLAMKYRNELLKLLIPQRIEALTYNRSEINVNTNQNISLQNYNEEDKIAILDAYRRIHRQDGSTSQPASLH